jgi:hypothetical protein
MEHRAVARTGLGVALLLASSAAAAEPLRVDLPALVARADLDYDHPASRSEEGMPVGNGRMGSLVWTTPSALHFQVNRVDLFALDDTSVSFPRADTDYASGAGYVDINLVDYGDDVFAGGAGPGGRFRQHLALYDGVMTAEGRGVTARVLAWPKGDVLAVEIEDRRAQPSAVSVDLRMLRYQVQYIAKQNATLAAQHAVRFETAEHAATSRLDIRGGKGAPRTLLTQQFQERAFYDASGLAAGIVGRPSQARYLNESTVRLTAAAGRGRFTILLASAASFDAKVDIGARALAALEPAAAAGFAALRAQTAADWHAYWSKGFVHLHSADGQADLVERAYTYFLYLMGASSRGAYPPRFGGMLWYTTGDMRRWGAQFWWANQNAYYGNLMPANRLELMDPLFAMYGGMKEAAARAARQQWGSEGLWIPETTFFSGLEALPEDIASELRELMLVRKPYAARSERFRLYAASKQRHSSRWNFEGNGRWEQGRWIVPDKGAEIFGHTTHILGVGARVAALAWQRYLFTADEGWLRTQAYPLLRGAAEFYRHFPNFAKGKDGQYHIHHVNNGESNWNSSDTPYELGQLHVIFPLAARASEILGVDAELRPLWRAIAQHLPPLPPGAGRRRGPFGGFVGDGPGEIEPLGPEAELKRRFLGFMRLGGFIDPEGIGGPKVFRNQLRLREGPGAIDAEHIAGLAGGIHGTLVGNAAPTLADAPVLRVFDGWPKDWDAAFALRAHGAFVVRAAQVGGKLAFVEIRSEAGEPCRLVNPWPGQAVALARDGRPAGELGGETVSFTTRRGETLLLTPRGAPPPPVQVPLAAPRHPRS